MSSGNQEYSTGIREKFDELVRLVREGIYQRFQRDPIVLRAFPYELKITVEIAHSADLLTFTLSTLDLEELPAQDLAEGVLNDYRDAQKEADLVAYARHAFPNADSVSLAPKGAYDPEVFPVVVILKFSGARVFCRFTRELWDHTATFAELQAHMERHGWRETVDHATAPVTLGDLGWIVEGDQRSRAGKKRRDYFITAHDDGLPTNEIGPWAEQKYRYVGMYAELFATGMKNRWPTRVYLDLFSGTGYSRVRDTDRVVLGSPMIALSLPDPFDAYVFADEDPESIDVLRTRVSRLGTNLPVTCIPGDVNEKVDRVLEVISQTSSKSTLSFCFLDPYKLNIHFDTVRRIAEGRAVDFLILLALYVDANRNIPFYVAESNRTIDLFIGDADWRPRWKAAEQAGETIVKFLAREYSTHMSRIGYLPMSIEQMVKIRTPDKNLPLYYLAFYSKHQTGLKFWSEVRKYANDQLAFSF